MKNESKWSEENINPISLKNDYFNNLHQFTTYLSFQERKLCKKLDGFNKQKKIMKKYTLRGWNYLFWLVKASLAINNFNGGHNPLVNSAKPVELSNTIYKYILRIAS